jgi:hypothetical protein
MQKNTFGRGQHQGQDSGTGVKTGMSATHGKQSSIKSISSSLTILTKK